MLKDLHKRLRPMGIIDILDETIDVYRKNFVLLAGIAAFLYVPLFLFTTTTQSMQTIMIKTADPTQTIWSVVKMGIFAILYMMGYVLVTAALTFAISERYLERETNVLTCYKRVLRPKLIFAFIWANVIIFVLFALPFIIAALLFPVLARMGDAGIAAMVVFWIIMLGLIIYAVHAMLRLTVLTPTLFIESQTAWSAIKRSWTLMKGHTGKALGLLLLTGIGISIIQSIIQAPFTVSTYMSIFSNPGKVPEPSIIGTIISTLSSTVLMPINSIVIIMLYYDMRIRKEGFDLELLARDLDEQTREFTAGGATALPQEQVTLPPTEEPPSNTEG